MPQLSASRTFASSIMRSVVESSTAVPSTSPVQPYNSLTAASFSGLLSRAAGQVRGSRSFLYFMSGVAPTDFSSLTSFSARQTDVLVEFQNDLVLTGGSDFQSVLYDDLALTATIRTNFVPATASGTATWFWWVTKIMDENSTTSSNTEPLAHQVIGSIGGPGSGADLEIGDVNITAGDMCRVQNLIIQFPSSWSY